MGDEEYIFDEVRILRANREPCLVCGHPTGDCEGEEVGPVRLFGEGVGKQRPEPGILVEEDLFEEVWITPYTRSRVLAAKAGTYITFQRAVDLGIKTG